MESSAPGAAGERTPMQSGAAFTLPDPGKPASAASASSKPSATLADSASSTPPAPEIESGLMIVQNFPSKCKGGEKCAAGPDALRKLMDVCKQVLDKVEQGGTTQNQVQSAARDKSVAESGAAGEEMPKLGEAGIQIDAQDVVIITENAKGAPGCLNEYKLDALAEMPGLPVKPEEQRHAQDVVIITENAKGAPGCLNEYKDALAEMPGLPVKPEEQRHGGDETTPLLIPGLTNGLVLDNIIPRVPWYFRPQLQTLSHQWRDAVAEVACHSHRLASTKSAPIILSYENDHEVSSAVIYEDEKWRKLPPVINHSLFDAKSLAIASCKGEIYLFFLEGLNLQGRLLMVTGGSCSWELIPGFEFCRDDNIIYAESRKIFLFPRSIDSSNPQLDRYPDSAERLERRASEGGRHEICAFDLCRRQWDWLPSLPMPINCELEGQCVLNLKRGLTYVGHEYSEHADENFPHVVLFSYDVDASIWVSEVIQDVEFDAIPCMYLSMFGDLFKIATKGDFQIYELSGDTWSLTIHHPPLNERSRILEVGSVDNDDRAFVYLLIVETTGSTIALQVFEGVLWKSMEKMSWQAMKIPLDFWVPPNGELLTAQKLGVYTHV